MISEQFITEKQHEDNDYIYEEKSIDTINIGPNTANQQFFYEPNTWEKWMKYIGIVR